MAGSTRLWKAHPEAMPDVLGRLDQLVDAAEKCQEGVRLNRCAPLRALAHPGQVLVSGSTADLLVDHLADGVFLKDLGIHRLRDLARPERVRQLCAPDLPIELWCILAVVQAG